MQSYTGSAPPEMASEYPRLKFGPFVLDTQNRSLSRGKDFINLSPKAFDALELLVKARGQLLTKQEMMTALWPATYVEEANLTTTISVIRKALGDEDKERKYIQTVSKTGYRLIAEVQEAKPASSQFPRLALWALPILAL
ncbi:MAG: transcriptional regulator, partial [Acidobacteria bacterium]|nr:transcriptional regulator [Acidobacteriota bacterium]